MNGNNGADQQPGGQLNHHQLSLLLNAAGGGTGGQQNAALMASLLGGGGPAGVGAPGFRGFGSGGGGGSLDDGVAASLEDQILQRVSALRAEAMMQHQQQHQHHQQHQQHQQQQQLEAAFAALQQQQQMSAMGALGGGLGGGLGQEALVARAAALRELGLGGGGQGATAASFLGNGGLERLQQQLDFSSRLEEIEMARRMHLAGLSGGTGPPGGVAVGGTKGGFVTSPSLSSAASSSAAAALRPPESISKGAAETVLPATRKGTKDARVPSSSPSSPLPTHKARRKEKAPSVLSSPKAIATSVNGSDGVNDTINVATASDKAKEELSKTPGTVIVPCRARGMPMDHNFKSAYFVISENAKHGEDLVCSYVACRNGGVKFRYCAHCLAPVAKRNFCRRHDHGMTANKQLPSIDANVGNDDDDDDMDEDEHASDKEPVDGPRAAAKVSKQEENASIQSGVSSSGESKRKREESEDLSGEDAVHVDVHDRKADDVKEVTIADVSEKRRKMWRNLLTRRPRTKDPRNLSSWLNEVLTVSDMEYPIDQLNVDPASGAAFYNGEAGVYRLGLPVSDTEPVDSGDLEKERVTDAGGKGDATKTSNKGNAKANIKSHTKASTKASIKAKRKKADAKVYENVVKKAKVKNSLGSSNAREGEEGSDIPTNNSPKRDSKSKEDQELPSETKTEEKVHQIKAALPATEGQTKTAFTQAEQDGFVGSFADWRDRKKGKALKKGTGSLRK